MIENEAKLSIAGVNIRLTASGEGAGPSPSAPRRRRILPGSVERVFEIG